MMFRAQATPTANVHLSQKWDMIEYETHRYNVRHMKSRVDLKPPTTFVHVFLKPKNLQSDLERTSAIQRDNRFLVERIAEINRKGSWTDNRNYHAIGSKNTASRQKDMMNLTYSNKIMLGRITDTHTSYNRNRLQDEYLLQQKQKAVILKYPQNWREIRDQIQGQRAEIRRKYIYPRFGVLDKMSQKQSGDAKDVDSEKSGKNAKSSKAEEKRGIGKKPGKGGGVIFTSKGEGSRSPKQRETGATAKQSYDKASAKTPQNIETGVAMGPSEEMAQGSADGTDKDEESVSGDDDKNGVLGNEEA